MRALWISRKINLIKSSRIIHLQPKSAMICLSVPLRSLILKQNARIFTATSHRARKSSLVKRTPIYDQTSQDFGQFLASKSSKPICGWLNDCILRRLCNGQTLKKWIMFLGDTPVIGFPTFWRNFRAKPQPNAHLYLLL